MRMDQIFTNNNVQNRFTIRIYGLKSLFIGYRVDGLRQIIADFVFITIGLS